jgi:uncharacterized protein
MKFQLDSAAAAYQIQSYQRGAYIVVNRQTYAHSLIISPRHFAAWPPASFEQLSAEDFEALAALQPKIVLFGSGAALRFPPAAVLAPLINSGIGVEVMDTGAACRTYMVLLAEGREVAAALLV